MIDATVRFASAPDVAVIELWDGSLPPMPGARVLPVEPRRWWLIGGDPPAVEALLDGRGALAPIGGGLVRATITGPGWRELLTVSALFDVHDPAFGTGAIARTVIHHIAVTVAVTGAESCEVYCAASYAATLEALWRAALGGG